MLAFLFIVISLNTYSQPGWNVVLPGDTVMLNLVGYTGSIQWQESSDSIIWSDIPGAITTPWQIIAVTGPTGNWYFRAVITDSLCPNVTPVYSDVIQSRVVATTADVELDSWFHGGIVFYIDSIGYGLISSQSDQSTSVKWGCNGTSMPGTTDTVNGYSNTLSIVTNCSTRPIAGSVCYDLVLNNDSDWFLPAKVQLNSLFLKKSVVGSFANVNYWSSSEMMPNDAWSQHFGAGMQSPNVKISNFRVRCIRSYTPEDSLKKVDLTVNVTNQPVSVTFSAQPVLQNVCLGDSASFSVIAAGTQLITYQWRKDGADISNATDSVYTIVSAALSDTGSYSCVVTNLCRSVESDAVPFRVIQLIANAGTSNNICNGQTSQLQASASSNFPAESGTISYVWSPVTGLSNPNISNPGADPDSTTVYTVTATDQLGCSAFDIVNVFVQNPYSGEQICMVTVDTVTWKNKIMWEKTLDVGSIGYNVYKEVSTNIYSGIGYVPFSDTAEYIDITSQPESYANRYKISVVDTCGHESTKSFYHMTMNLTIAAFGNTMGLTWTHYIDESGSFTPLNYYIYRGTTPTNMQLLDSVPGTITSYNDNNVFVVYYYIIGVKSANACITAKSETISFSNKKDNSSFIGAVEYNGSGSEALSIFPNPINENTTVKFFNPVNEVFRMKITDPKGRVIRQSENITGNEIKIERKDLKSGVYFIEIKSANRTFRGKIIVE